MRLLISSAVIAAALAGPALAASQSTVTACARTLNVPAPWSLVQEGIGTFRMVAAGRVSARAAAEVNACAGVPSPERVTLATASDSRSLAGRLFGGNAPRVLCPYPHRPSDSAFLNGAGYIIKDDVRARLGCR
jgi:hypothetical protein